MIQFFHGGIIELMNLYSGVEIKRDMIKALNRQLSPDFLLTILYISEIHTLIDIIKN